MTTQPHAQPSTDNITNAEILAMLNQKGVCLTRLGATHRFDLADILHVINGKKCYPNIARIVANCLNTTPDMLWPHIYPMLTGKANTSIFVLRVTLP